MESADRSTSLEKCKNDIDLESWWWKHEDPEGYRSFWQRSHWNVLSIFIHQREAVLLDQAVLCSLLVTSKDVRTAILEGSCRGQACICFEAKSDLKRVRRFSLWLQRHAQVIQELQLLLGTDWIQLPDLQTAEASVAAGLQTAAAQQPLTVQAYSCSPATPSMQTALLQHLGSSLSSVQFTCHQYVRSGDELSAGFTARWRSVLGQPAAAVAALGSLRSLQVTESYQGTNVAAGYLQLSSLSQLTELRLLGRTEVPATRLQRLPVTLQELQVTLSESSSQLSLAHLTALTQLHLGGSYTLAATDTLPPKLAAATLLCAGEAAGPVMQLSRLQRLQLGAQCAPTAEQLRQLHSRLLGLTELQLAYSSEQQAGGAPPPNLAAESAAWPGLPLRQLSLQHLTVPAAALQRLAEVSAGLSSLEMLNCRFECTPREVAKVLAGMSKLRVFRMSRLFRVTPWCSNALMAGTREVLRTLGCLNLHTLEIFDMPLGSLVLELAVEQKSWLQVRQLSLERLVLNSCNMNDKTTYALLKCCKKLRELELVNNYGAGCLGDRAFGVGEDECGWRRLEPVKLPKLEWLFVHGSYVTPAGVAHLAGVKKF